MALDFKKMMAEAWAEKRAELAREKEDEKAPLSGNAAEKRKEAADAKVKEAVLEKYRARPFTLGKEWKAPWADSEDDKKSKDRFSLSDGCWYFPDFVTASEEKELVSEINAAPLSAWVQLSTRRLQQWGGQPTKEFEPEDLPTWGDRIVDRIQECEFFTKEKRPNHILMNEYRVKPPGGIFAHKDGPLYHPLVAILSLQGTVCLDFWEKPPHSGSTDPPTHRVVLKPRSLIVFEGRFYKDLYHSVETKAVFKIGDETLNAELAGVKPGDIILRRKTRLSLTLRHVPPCASAKKPDADKKAKPTDKPKTESKNATKREA